MPREKVLIADDMQDVLDLCVRILGSEGYDVTCVRNGLEAVKLAERDHFDLFLTDQMMPGITGFEAAQAIRKVQPECVFAMLTGFGTMDTAIEALRLGFSELLFKPFRPQELQSAVKRALEKGRLQRGSERLNALAPVLELGKSAIATADRNALAQAVIRTACSELGADIGILVLRAPGGRLRVEASVGLDTDQVSVKGTGFVTAVAEELVQVGEEVFVQSAGQAGPRVAELMRQVNAESLLLSPLLAMGELIGAIILAKPKANPPFGPVDRDLLGILCHQATTALQNAERFEQIRETYQELQQELNRLSDRQVELLRQLSEEGEEVSATPRGQFAFSEVNHLTGGIVHDIRSGLMVIRNMSGFLEHDLEGSIHEPNLQKIAQSADFCELVLRNLSALGGRVVFQPVSINLETIVHDVYSMLAHKLVGVELVTDIDPDVTKIVADEGQIRQVFMNLVKNAGEAMPDGGELVVRARQESEMLRIQVSDTGHGISKGDQARLFRTLFTTKERGYGLGLHIVHTIIERHGGTIEVQSKVGEGTTFTIHLPIGGREREDG